jgi:hypothetical protein
MNERYMFRGKALRDSRWLQVGPRSPRARWRSTWRRRTGRRIRHLWGRGAALTETQMARYLASADGADIEP